MHAHTPHLTVVDPRGLAVRVLDYHRDTPGTEAGLRVHHTRFDARGRQVEQRDPRLWSLPQAPANLVTVHALSGQVLGTDGVDNGWQRRLPGEARQVVRQWDGRGSQRRVEYDELLRPLAVFERLEQRPEQCNERLAYADGSVEHAQHNRCGRLIRHDDPAGSLEHSAFSLKGEASIQRRRFLEETDWPDWPVDSDARDALLEPGEGAFTFWQHGPLGQALEQTDAAGHRQSFHSNLSGELHQVRLQLAGQPVKTLLENARYNAMAQVLEETLGNGVTTRRTYRGEDGRLLSLGARCDNGEMLQDIHYDYDPAGNVISLEDRAQPLRHFANQRIEPRCEYRYDSLYQLIEATGWESGTVSRGPGSLNDPQARSNYRQTYRYDAGGNLLDLTHVGAQSHSRHLGAARHSNRCLAFINDRPPSDEDFLERFDANGNLLALQPGGGLHWDVRNQLSDVQPVSRDGATSDTERYRYDAAGQRVRKQRSTQAAGRSLSSEVRYLPGLEVHENQASGEHLQAVTVQAGTCSVRVLHWLAGRPDEVAQDQERYGLTDHLSSHSLELDQTASLISHEVFHPFGSTAWWAARSDIEASYKTIRYSGKERDMTGLYYYGARYYVPWLQRWLNPDPAGAVDGLNLYRMVSNSPVGSRDPDGRQGMDVMDDVEFDLATYRGQMVSSGLDNFSPQARRNVRSSVHSGRRWIKNTLKAFDNRASRRQVTDALSSTFGADVLNEGFRSDLKRHIFDTLREARGYLARLSAEEGWRLLMGKLNDDEGQSYSVFSRINGSRIVLDQAVAQEGGLLLSVILLHESLHAVAMRNDRMDDDDIVDYWYSVPRMDGPVDKKALEKATHDNAKALVATGPVEDNMGHLERAHYARQINQVTDFLGLARAPDSGKRNEYFRTIPRVRKAVVSRNADSLTGIALMFRNHRR